MRIQLFEDGKAPHLGRAGDAGYDCYSRVDVTVGAGETTRIPLGFGIYLRDGYEAEIRGRSGNSLKGLLVHTGTVDSNYTGEVWAIVTNLGKEPFVVKAGERPAQMIILECYTKTLYLGQTYDDVANSKATQDYLLYETRGNSGFGSSGK